MKICIILREPYPIGMACSGRIHLYARGLIHQGHDVKLIIPLPLDRPGQIWNTMHEGIFERVPYEYSWKKTVRSRNFIGRRIHDLIAPLKAAVRCLKYRPNFVLLTGTSTYLMIIFRLVCFFIGAKFILERSEIPFFSKNRLNILDRLYVQCIYKIFDGLIVISDSLLDYFDSKIRRRASLLKIPILVDVDKNFDPSVPRTDTIVYTGTLTQNKDGVLTIIECFGKIADKFQSYTLEMTGNLSDSSIQNEIRYLVEKYQLQNRIRFLGFVNRETLLRVQNRARVLVLAKPNSRQSSACLPTKLGEYLSTGNPVLVTKVGEISRYLKDGVTAFIAEPTVEAFTDRLHEVLSDLDYAKKVGQRGQKIARENFDFGHQTIRLGNFLNYIATSKDNLA